jgi:response regulator RpfG family c-di-GMP phosphodiesterase
MFSMGLKILMVDDDKVAVFLQRIILDECDFTKALIHFSNGPDALGFLDRDHVTCDDYFIFLDVNMPGMSGWEFLDAIKLRPYSQKVFISLACGNPDANELEKIRQSKQIIHLFEKPVDEALCTTIKQLPALKKYFPELTLDKIPEAIDL